MNVNAPPVDPLLSLLESKILASCTCGRKGKVNVFRKLHGHKPPFDRPEIILTGKSIGYMVSIIFHVLQMKVNKKYHSQMNNQSNYTIRANLSSSDLSYTEANEINVDPYLISIKLGNETHNLMSNYDGGDSNVGYPNQYQPGNCRLRRTAPHSHTISYNNNITKVDLEKDSHKFLLAIEIARRKVIDYHTEKKAGKKDTHVALPVAVAVYVARKLISDNRINVNLFWKKDGPYHVFSGKPDERTARFNALIAKYKEIENLGTMVEVEDHIARNAPPSFGFKHLRKCHSADWVDPDMEHLAMMFNFNALAEDL
jgi:hypothetical protein